MSKHTILSLAASAIILGGSVISFSAFAQEEVPGHPRVNQVEQRIDNQESHVNSEEQSGKITPTQAARDDARLNKQQNSVANDEAKNGGHITKAEQKNLNKRLNKNKKINKKQKTNDATAGAPTAPSN